MDDSIKQALLDRFRDYLDTVDADSDMPDPQPTTDLHALLIELAGLRTEVRGEARLFKDALDQFRGVFDTLQASHDTLRQELDRARAAASEQAQALLRPLLLDVIDIRDRLAAALRLAEAVKPHWTDRWRRLHSSGGGSWQEGLRMTLRRLDQVLLDRRVVQVQSVGRPFDPLLARVVATAADESVPEGDVIEEVRPGFLWDDRVLRIAEVIVCKGGAGKGERP